MPKDSSVYLIDTNIFLRSHIREDHVMYLECTKVIKLVERGHIKAFICSLVLAEVLWTMKSYYHLERKDTTRYLKSLLRTFKGAIVDNYDHQKALKLFSLRTVSFTDACLASIPQLQNGTWILVSYDKDFDRLGVSRLEPKDISKTNAELASELGRKPGMAERPITADTS